MMREALTYQTTTIFGLYPLVCCFLLFGISIFKVLDRFKDQELGYLVLGLIFLGSSMIDIFNKDEGPLQNPKDSFYYGYGVALFQKIIIDKLPNRKYQLLIRVICMFAYPLLVSFNQCGPFFCQIMLSGLSLYMDLVSECNQKKLFQSYNNYKQQLVKFKNLVENGIPQGISIIKQDLSSCLFGNDAFRRLVKINGKMSTRAHFSQFFIQNNPENGQTSPSQSENKTLVDLIETAKQRWEQGHPDEEFSCNVIYSKCDIKNINNVEEEYCQDNIYEAKISQIIWDEEPAIAIMIYDITTQYTILSLKAADAQKDALLATVSHELRTPLNGMLGMIQVIQKRIKDIEILHYLKICKNSGSLLLSLVNSLLDLNQIQAKTIKLYPQRINLEELLNDMVNLFEVQCQQKKIYLKVKLMMSPADKYIFTDQERLSQILINLIGNALKFTSEGGITISVAPSKHKDHVEFSVTDTGVGIKEEDKKKLFQVYGKLDQANSRMNQQGVGLGLTISNNLAKLLSNVSELQSIKLESHYGKGSNFHFFVKKRLDFLDNQPNQENPLNTSANLDESSFMESNSIDQKINNYLTPLPKNLESLKSSPINSSSFQDIPLHKTIAKSLKVSQWSTDVSSPSVIIVDDNPFNLIVAEHLVAAQGCKVKTALSGKAAIDLVVNTWLKSEQICLILMDLQMPEMDGYQTTRNLKNLMQNKRIPEIPIVALTANDSEADKRACFESGMSEHLSKPLKEGDLTRVLRRYSTADSLQSRSNRKEFKTTIH